MRHLLLRGHGLQSLRVNGLFPPAICLLHALALVDGEDAGQVHLHCQAGLPVVCGRSQSAEPGLHVSGGLFAAAPRGEQSFRHKVRVILAIQYVNARFLFLHSTFLNHRRRVPGNRELGRRLIRRHLQKGPRLDDNLHAGQPQHLRQGDAAQLAVLLSKNPARPGRSQFRISPRGVRPRPQVRIHQRIHGSCKRLPPAHVDKICVYALFVCQQRQRRLRNRRGHTQPGQCHLFFCARCCRPGGLHLCPAMAEVKRLPRKQDARAGCPEGAICVGHNATLRPSQNVQALRQQHPQHALTRSAIALPHAVQPWHCIHPGQAHAGLRRVVLLQGCAHSRIVCQRIVHGLRHGELARRRRGCLLRTRWHTLQAYKKNDDDGKNLPTSGPHPVQTSHGTLCMLHAHRASVSVSSYAARCGNAFQAERPGFRQTAQKAVSWPEARYVG